MDLPPIINIVDARVISESVDSFVFTPTTVALAAVTVIEAVAVFDCDLLSFIPQSGIVFLLAYLSIRFSSDIVLLVFICVTACPPALLNSLVFLPWSSTRMLSASA